jgi:precorrin-2 dehydrogenase/sirohydrochlorin ferrochelatase
MQSLPVYFKLDCARIALVGDDPDHHGKRWLFEHSPAEVAAMTPDQALMPGALDGFWMVFVQVGDEALARALSDAARAAHVLVNVVDKPALSDFYMPAIIDRGRVVIAIGTGGTAPVLATRLRSQIESRLPEGLDKVAELSERLRETMKAEVPDFATRRAMWRKVLSGPAAHAAVEGDLDKGEALALQLMRGEQIPPQGRVLFLACDSPDRLTLRALRTMVGADRVVGGRAEVADYARRDAHREEDATAEALAAWALSGETVVRISDVAEPAVMAEVKALGAEVETLV